MHWSPTSVHVHATFYVQAMYMCICSPVSSVSLTKRFISTSGSQIHSSLNHVCRHLFVVQRLNHKFTSLLFSVSLETVFTQTLESYMLTVSRIDTIFALAFNPYQLLKSMLCYVKSIISHLKIMHSLLLWEVQQTISV